MQQAYTFMLFILARKHIKIFLAHKFSYGTLKYLYICFYVIYPTCILQPAIVVVSLWYSAAFFKDINVRMASSTYYVKGLLVSICVNSILYFLSCFRISFSWLVCCTILSSVSLIYEQESSPYIRDNFSFDHLISVIQMFKNILKLCILKKLNQPCYTTII